jgi:RimJ/RimL family protein N-acetyltransferase
VLRNNDDVLSPLILTDGCVRLEPIAPEHATVLATSAAEDRRSYGYTWVPEGIVEAERYVAAALAHQSTGRAMVHVVRQLYNGRIIGTTRFLDLEVFGWPPPWPPGVAKGQEPSNNRPPSVAEIGSTWYAASAQRTGINLRVKLLQLTHAFDVWQVLRVTLKTDARNTASRAAIERLGAHPEGVRRAHAPASDGTVRDTAYYSITKPEWLGVRDQLAQRVSPRPESTDAP